MFRSLLQDGGGLIQLEAGWLHDEGVEAAGGQTEAYD